MKMVWKQTRNLEALKRMEQKQTQYKHKGGEITNNKPFSNQSNK